MSELADYQHLMLGHANQTSSKPEAVDLVTYAQTASGKEHMRGIPLIAPRVGGTMAGTDPLQALLDSEDAEFGE
jgi:hypothetical protein